jgi:hypothetical protein
MKHTQLEKNVKQLWLKGVIQHHIEFVLNKEKGLRALENMQIFNFTSPHFVRCNP